MGMLSKVLPILALSVMVLNMFGAAVGAIWLAVLGKWSAIGWGLLGLIGGSFVISLAMLPGLIFVLPVVTFQKWRFKAGIYMSAVLGALYTTLVISIWCMGALYVLTLKARPDSVSSLIPALLWAYGVATGPVAFLAHKESQGGGGQASAITTAFSQIGFLILIICVPVFQMSLPDAAVLFIAVMFIGMCVQLAAGLKAVAEDDAMSSGVN